MPGSDRQIGIDLLARDKSGPAVKSFSGNLDDAADSADRASKSTEMLGLASDKAGGRIKKLDHDIASVNQNLAFLHEAMGDAQDQAERLDISKGIRKAEADLRRLSKSQDFLKALTPDPSAVAKSFGGSIAAAGGQIASLAGGSVGPVVGTAIGVAAAPVVMSALGSALSAGAGAGVLGVGIMAAVKGDSQIQVAGKQAGARFMNGLEDAATGSLKGPILDAINILSAAGDRATRRLADGFDALASSVAPLAEDLATVADILTDSLADAASSSGPALEGLGDTMVILADGVGDFITIVSDGGPEAASNLQLIAGATADTVRWTGLLIKTFNDLSDNPWLTGPLIPLLKKHYSETAEKTADLAAKQRDAARAADDQASSLEALADQLRAETDPAFRLLKAETDLGEARTKLAKATDKYGANSAEARDELNNMARASIELQAATGELAGTFNGRISPALRSTLTAAGLTEREISRLEAEFQQAKASGDRFAKTYKATLSARTEDAQARIRALEKRLRGIKDETVRVNVIFTERRNNKVADQLGDMREFGGPVRANKAYIVGEKRAEVFVPDQNGKIIPSVDQFNRGGYSGTGMAGGGWAGSAGPANVNVKLSVASSADSKVAELINYLIRNGDIVVGVG